MRISQNLIAGWCVLLTLLMAVPLCAQQIAFTWDDLPAHSALPVGETRVEIGHQLISAMKDAHMPPVFGFVNGVQLEHEPLSAPMLKDWRDAGFQLGNHAWSHMNLNEHTLADWEADVLKNEPVLQSYAGGEDWRWLRFPYLAEGDTPEKRAAARKFLADHGYRIAGVTMSFDDYAFNEPYARCIASNNVAAIAKLETSYLKAADDEIEHSRAVAKAIYGREIPYVLLMHVGAFDARMLPRLINLYRDRGFTFVTLQEAEKDRVYKNDMELSLPAFEDSPEAAKTRSAQLPPKPALDLDLNALCR
jgi:peptidoglycan-N-acetylglucosamine deacetylase